MNKTCPLQPSPDAYFKCAFRPSSRQHQTVFPLPDLCEGPFPDRDIQEKTYDFYRVSLQPDSILLIAQKTGILISVVTEGPAAGKLAAFIKPSRIIGFAAEFEGFGLIFLRIPSRTGVPVQTEFIEVFCGEGIYVGEITLFYFHSHIPSGRHAAIGTLRTIFLIGHDVSLTCTAGICTSHGR